MITLYLICAAAGSVVLIILFVLSLIGVDHGVNEDATHHFGMDDASASFQLLSFRSLVAALAFFGLGGMLAHSAGAGGLFTFLVSVAAGFCAMLLVAWLMHLMLLLQEDGTLDMAAAIGESGTCHLTIPGGHAGAGKVLLTVRERSLEVDAITRGEPIPTGAGVRVVEVVNPNTVEVAAER